MLYLLDANVLIRAHEDYYPIDRIPQYWSWLEQQARDGVIKVPIEIYMEVARARGLLGDWIRSSEIRDALILDEDAEADQLDCVIREGYGIRQGHCDTSGVGQDPFLVAYALVSNDRVVVTRETSKPRARGANRKIPDVCDTLGVRWMNDFTMIRELGFSTR